MIFKEVKNALADNKNVLFSGTPCQVAALKSFLGDKHYDNLFTIDIICHGVPSIQMFQDYLTILESSCGKIYDFKFRDKSGGWGYTGSAHYKDKKGYDKKLVIPFGVSSYVSMFLESDIFRENCYSCKYANANRVGDITIGDYWGIEKEHAESLLDNGGCIDETKGVSCLIVNTQKGKQMLEDNKDNLVLVLSEFVKVQNGNKQLKAPGKKGRDREYILELYKNEGYSAVEKWYRKKKGVKWYLSWGKCWIPISWKKKIKRVIRK